MRTSIPTAHGASLAVDPANLDVYTTIMLSGGRWDDHVFGTCRRLLAPGQTFFDIGANAGYMAICMAHHFRDADVEVIAFEPQHSLALAVARSAALNGLRNVRVYECLLGDSEGRAELFVPAHGIHASMIAREDGARRVQCQQTTIDAQVDAGAVPAPHVIKIDVEGAEMTVFRGAEATIRSHQPAIVFESDENMDRFGYGRADVIRYLSGLADYTFCAITDTGLVALDSVRGDFIFPDLVALPARLSGEPGTP